MLHLTPYRLYPAFSLAFRHECNHFFSPSGKAGDFLNAYHSLFAAPSLSNSTSAVAPCNPFFGGSVGTMLVIFPVFQSARST